MKHSALVCIATVVLILGGCGEAVTDKQKHFEPSEMIDLGTLVTEKLTEQVWGERYVSERGFDRLNVFETTRTELHGGALTLQNSYYTFFNHGGPHIDAPIHVGLDGGVDSYPIDVFSGPLKVFDVSHFPAGRTVAIEAFEDANIRPGDIVIIYTGYKAPKSDELPNSTTLTWETAEYLARVPVRAYGTDARSVASVHQSGLEDTTAFDQPLSVRVSPVHHAFLSRRIPVYEQLFNVAALLEKERMYFTGVPVNVKSGDGMIVRPVVFMY